MNQIIEIDNIMFSKLLSHLQKELESIRDKISNLHTKSMFRISKIGVLPEIFLDMKYDVTIFAACMFGTAIVLQWITKGD